MTNLFALLLTATLCLIAGCSPVKVPATNQYQLSAYSELRAPGYGTNLTLLVTAPEAVAQYQTNQMLYMAKPFELASFAQNAWVSPPADMLFPLLVQSMQNLNYFRAVSSGPNSEETDYRLDTQLLGLKQNFITKPSQIELSVKAVLTQVREGRVVSSRVFREQQRCPMDNPYGGVIAANQATKRLTTELSRFVVSKTSHSAIKK